MEDDSPRWRYRKRGATDRSYRTAREMDPALRQPADLEGAGDLMLLACNSPRTRVAYEQAIRDFLAWRRERDPLPVFDRNTVLTWRRSLIDRKLAPASVNQRLTA